MVKVIEDLKMRIKIIYVRQTSFIIPEERLSSKNDEREKRE